MRDEHTTGILERVQSFSRTEVQSAASQWDLGQPPDKSLWQRAAQLGLTGIEVAAEQGGMGLGFGAKAAICEALAQADFGFAMSVINTQNVALNISRLGNERLRRQYLPSLLSGELSACTALTEPGAGSDFAAIRTHVVDAGDHWILSGEKQWIINGRHAGLAIVYAQCAAPGDRDGIGAFLVDLRQEGCRRYAIDSSVRQSSMGTGGFELKGVRTPRDHCLIAPGQAFHAIMTEINGARAYVAAMCVGMLSAALSSAHAHGDNRQTFGRSLYQHQAWRFTVARAETDLAAMRALVNQAALAFDTQVNAQLLCAQAKVFAVEACRQHLPRLLHAMGAHGLSATHATARHAAATQMASLTDGSDDMLLERIAHLTHLRSS
jgi:alkylation response protein AidB-like acyl-CoA dehydrogenase